MAKFFKSTKGKIITIVLALVLVVGGIAGYFIYRNNKITNEHYLSAICRNRVQNAQYLPNINKIAVNQTQTASLMTAGYNQPSSNSSRIENIDKTITLENFNTVIDEIGDIDSPFDREFTITDIKEEVYTVLANTSVFDRWIYIDGELGGTGKYYISYNQNKEHITIIRSSGFQPWVYDSSTGKIVWNEDFNYSKPNYPIEEDVIYKIDYYYNEQGVEVVECEIVNFLNYYEDTMNVKYQYVKNVKDTSFTKYIIEPIIYLSSTANDGSWGYDIDTKNPLGTSRQFIQMDYTNQNDVALLFVKQAFANAYNDVQNSTAINYYKKLNNELYLYNASYCYGDNFGVSTSFATHTSGTLFDMYLRNNDYHAGAVVGTPDNDYLSRSSDKIESMYREMYYTDGTNQLSVSPGSYYIKKDGDNDLCYFKLQNISLMLNQSITELARNTMLSNEKIGLQLLESPMYIDISENTSKHEYELFVDDYLKNITQNIVDNSYLKNNYTKIRNANAKTVKANDTSAISDYITLENFTNTSSLNGTNLTFTASANINKTILLKEKAEYQLCLIAKGDGNNFVILQNGNANKYKDKNMDLSISGTYNLSEFKTSIEDEYTIGIAMVMNYNNRLILCSETKSITFTDMPQITLANTTNNGFETSYLTKYVNNSLKIVTTVEDIENPTIEAQSNIALQENSTIADLLEKLNFADNGQLANIVITNGTTTYYNYNDLLTAGNYTITIYDYAGNSNTINLTITIA